MMEILTALATALLQVIAIDLVLAGENAVVIGFAAAGLKASQTQGHGGRHSRSDGAEHALCPCTRAFWP